MRRAGCGPFATRSNRMTGDPSLTFDLTSLFRPPKGIAVSISKESLLDVYSISVFAKDLDDKVQELLMSGAVNTTLFSWRGSELLGAVIGLSMRKDDYLVAYYRD